MKNSFLFNILILLIVLLFMDCNQPGGTMEETPTSGNIKISVDESFKLLMDSEIFLFTASYKNAIIRPEYKTEYDVINDFMNDSVQTIVTAKKLTKEQTEYLKSKTLNPKTYAIAIDAVALIVNVKNPDTLIQVNKFKQILAGNIKKWEEINPKNKTGKIEVVFDNSKSANARYLKEKLYLQKFPDNCYTANTNDSVIDYVEKHKNAIGIISVNWISDNNDSVSNNFLKRIKVVGLTSEFDPEGTDYYRPYPAYIKDESYPFRREVYMITRETFTGLGSGFIWYVSGEKGQRIVLKSGLVPSTMPSRVVKMKSKFD
ncbi:MAG: substrate-binding domain-containing protein [Bacteroidales bacterium]